MIPVDVALFHARVGRPVFPCQWQGPKRKQPLTAHGKDDASTDPAVIAAWWKQWPGALVGVRTGRGSGFVVLDIDVKVDRANGYDTLENLGFGVLPDTPMVHTASGGLHLWFVPPADREIRNTEGARGRGIGPGLDWRGDGGYVIVPSLGSGYSWDPHWNLETVALVPVPVGLLPREPERRAEAKPVNPEMGLSPYAEAALDHACRNIQAAPNGEQESTLHSECFSIGTLAGAEAIPAAFARRSLHWAARQIPNFDRARPWGADELARKVDRSFDAGLRHPREASHA